MSWIKSKDRLPVYQSRDRNLIPIRIFKNNSYVYGVGIYNEDLKYWQPNSCYKNDYGSFYTNIPSLALDIEWYDDIEELQKNINFYKPK